MSGTWRCLDHATMAQSVEQLIRNQQVKGSIPFGSSILQVCISTHLFYFRGHCNQAQIDSVERHRINLLVG